MDISKLTHGTKLVLGASIAFLIVSIFKWQEIDFQGIASVGVNMWHGWGVLAGLLAHETQAESERWKVGYIWLDPTTRAPR